MQYAAPVTEWREELVALGRQAVRWGEEREVNWGRWPGVQVHRPSVHTAWATVQQEGPHLARWSGGGQVVVRCRQMGLR